MPVVATPTRTRRIHTDTVLGGYRVAGSLTTALAGSNNDLVFTGTQGNASDNDVSITYVVAGNSTPLSVTTSGKDITVNVATNGGGTATSTAAQVTTAIRANLVANSLVTIANAASNDGTGVVTALAKTNLTSGVSYTIGQGGGGIARVQAPNPPRA